MRLMHAGAALLVAYLLWRLSAIVAVRRGIALGASPVKVMLTAAAVAFLGSASTWSWAIALGAVGVAATTDVRSGLIFDACNVTVAVLALAVGAASSQLDGAVAGLCVGGGALLALYLATAGRGLGLGDVKCAAALGAALGVQHVVLALAIAFIAGGIYGGWLLVYGGASRNTAVRFGPFLATGTYLLALTPFGAP